MVEFAKIAGLFLLSSVKFLFAPSTTVASGYSFVETIAITFTGGVTGFFIFFKFGTVIIKWYNSMIKSKEKLRFTKKNRFIVKIKRDYGLYGLALLTPCLLSMPVGSFLASAYFSDDKRTVPTFILSVLFWSLLLTSVSMLFKS